MTNLCTSPMPTLLRLSQVADRTGVPVETLRWLRKRGQGPRMFLLAGRLVAYERDVISWVEAAAAQAEPVAS